MRSCLSNRTFKARIRPLLLEVIAGMAAVPSIKLIGTALISIDKRAVGMDRVGMNRKTLLKPPDAWLASCSIQDGVIGVTTTSILLLKSNSDSKGKLWNFHTKRRNASSRRKNYVMKPEKTSSRRAGARAVDAARADRTRTGPVAAVLL